MNTYIIYIYALFLSPVLCGTELPRIYINQLIGLFTI